MMLNKKNNFFRLEIPFKCNFSTHPSIMDTPNVRNVFAYTYKVGPLLTFAISLAPFFPYFGHCHQTSTTSILSRLLIVQSESPRLVSHPALLGSGHLFDFGN